MADLQELFSRLRSTSATASPAPDQRTGQHQQQLPQQQQQQQQPSIWAQPPSYQQPSVSSPLFSPPIHTPNPHHPSAIMSPSLTPGPGENKSNDLLNLLKFNANQQATPSSPLASLQNIAAHQPASAPQPPSLPQNPRTVSASDLVASFHSKPSNASSLRISMPSPQPEQKTQALADAQNFLLGLLNRPKQPIADTQLPHSQPIQAPQASQSQEPSTVPVPSVISAQVVEPVDATPVRMFGSVSRENTPFEAPTQAKKGPVFTYVNPFEQMTASSPAPSVKAEGPKHQRDASQAGDSDAAPNAKNRKIASTVPSPLPSPRPDQAASDAPQQSVSEALSGIGEKVDKQVEKALAQADATETASKEQNKSADDVADSWESADADETSSKENKDYDVQVYNFPMRPFVSITVNKTKDAIALRPDSLMDIARLKKEFEQIDRCLVTASSSHIVYAMSKNGGFRVIRQDSGKDKQVFRSSQERVFNVQISTATGAHKDTETVLATGVNGSIFWTTITKVEGDAFDELNLESQGFILPPVPVQDDNTSGSPVKTRAKMSSRNADFFAISRGKSIYVISPFVARDNQYTDKKTRVVDNDKYLGDRCLKIHTGKAGKDFAFSGDDSLLASLDKSGRIKFWDIRDIAEQARDTSAGKRAAIERKDPLLTLTTSLPLEKATPSSIMFVDKERPCVKGVALRYLLVGLKQNHILQLWDLGLNKPVQELHFPHEKDSDAICSISYHAKTGIIALGHPTRNSIYFIHLSAPRYNIPSMDQARYTTMLADQDPALPRPESTAIMSGIRELSFASKGQLRSIDMLHTPVASETSSDVLFELYAMHSKGVTCMNIKHEDLGWSRDNKVLRPVDAEATGYITVANITPTTGSTEAPAKPTKSASAAPASAAAPASEKADLPKPAPAPAKPALKQETPVNGAVKAEKPKKVAAEPAPVEPAQNPSILTPASYSLAARPKAPAVEPTPPPKPIVAPAVAEKPSKSANGVSQVDTESINKTVTEILAREMDALYRKLDDDKRIQDAAAAAKQDAVLRLVSSTLTDNVEKTLSKIITTNITNTVVPAVVDLGSTLLNEKLTTAVAQHVAKVVPHELKGSLAPAIASALQDKEVLRVISDQTASKLAPQVEQSFSAILRNSIIPNFNDLALSSSKKAIADVEQRFQQRLRENEVQRQKDNAKIEQLTDLVVNLSSTIHEMAAGQSAFQEQILKVQRQLVGSQDNSSSHSVTTGENDVVQSIEDPELEAITSLMTQHRYEEGTIQWLQSDRQGELFDKLFVRINPAYLQRLSPLVSLSVSAALTSSFDQHVDQRLEWLGTVLSTINLNDPEIREVAPKIMDVLQQRMQGAYMQIAEGNPQEPALRLVVNLSRQISDIKERSLMSSR